MKKFRYLALFCLLLPIFSDAADMSSANLIKELQGVYKHRFMSNNIPSGGSERWQAEDVIEIVPYDDSHIYIRASLEFINGHMCAIWGIAEYEKGTFVYHDPKNSSDESPSCTLKISASKDDLMLTDADSTNDISTCGMYCGARGSFYNYSIAKSSKRRIRYLDRLKASREYSEAVDAFKKEQSPTQR